MSCTHRDLHIDLLFGELPAAEARELRAAIELCEECAADFAMMEGIESFAADALMVEAPKSLDAAIMAAAMAAHPTTPESIEKTTNPTAAPSFWARLVAFIEGAAIGPQFAMATVMLLVVAVGLWYVPKRESQEVLGSTVVIADPEGEAVASADDPSVRERDDALLAPAQIELEPEPNETNQGTEVATNETSRPRPGANSQRETQGPRIQANARGASMDAVRGAAQSGVQTEPAELDDEGIENAISQANAWAEEMGVGEPLPSYEGGAEPQQQAPSMEWDLSQATQAPSTASTRPATQTQPSTQAPSTQPQYRSVAPMQEVPPPNPASLSRALLQLARNHRTQGACQEAVRHYEELLRRYPSSPEVPEALLESGDCYRRLGRLSDAERVLQRAMVYASSRQTAQRELTRLETLRSAQRRRTARPSRAAEAAPTAAEAN